MKQRKHRRRLRRWVKWTLVMTVCFITIMVLSTFCSDDIVQTDMDHAAVVLDHPAEEPETTSRPYGLDEFQAINPYVMAIVHFENSDGTYRVPVVETFSTADADYWMSHDIYGNPSSLGSAFVDEHTPNQDSSNHLLINGHSSFSNQRMFTFMLNYRSADYFNANSTFRWIDDLGSSTYTIIAFAHYPMNESIQTAAVFLNTHIDATALNQYLIQDEPYILHKRDIDLSADRYLSFVTCDQDDKSNRYILIARKNRK